MTRNILRVIVVVLSSRFALPQAPGNPSPQEILASTLADLRGLSETFETTGIDTGDDRSTLSLSLVRGPVGGSQSSAAWVPAAVHPSAGTVSAKRLRHRTPKAARKAYENAAKLARKRHAQEAVKELQRAIALDSGFAEAHDDLGVLYACLGRYPEAAAELRRAIELVPEESLPRSNLAWVLFAMGQGAEGP